MRHKWHRILLPFVLSFILVLGGCTREEYVFDSHVRKAIEFDCFFRKEMLPELAPDEFHRLVSTGSIEDMSLTIYYMKPWILTWAPVGIDDLIGWCGTEAVTKYGEGGIVVIEGTELAELTELLILLSNEEPMSLKQDYRINGRIYYVFKDKYRRTIFEVAMWAYSRDNDGKPISALFVNGIFIEQKEIYYDIVIPFLPENVAGSLKEFGMVIPM